MFWHLTFLFQQLQVPSPDSITYVKLARHAHS